MPIVWTFPDHHIEITYLSERWLHSQIQDGETTAQAVERLSVQVQEKAPHLRQAVPQLVASKDLPTDRTTRPDWTFDRRTKVVRDMTVKEKDERDHPIVRPTEPPVVTPNDRP